MDEELELISRFHGHLGAYAILGYRMGQIASRELGEHYKKKRAVVYTGLKPPVSCLVDGVQLGSGCTLGKGNITVEDRGEARAVFTDDGGRSLSMKLVNGLQDRIHASFGSEDPHAFCMWVWEAKDEELFVVEKE